MDERGWMEEKCTFTNSPVLFSYLGTLEGASDRGADFEEYLVLAATLWSIESSRYPVQKPQLKYGVLTKCNTTYVQ